jgi:hypothetical protein
VVHTFVERNVKGQVFVEEPRPVRVHWHGGTLAVHGGYEKGVVVLVYAMKTSEFKRGKRVRPHVDVIDTLVFRVVVSLHRNHNVGRRRRRWLVQSRRRGDQQLV